MEPCLIIYNDDDDNIDVINRTTFVIFMLITITIIITITFITLPTVMRWDVFVMITITLRQMYIITTWWWWCQQLWWCCYDCDGNHVDNHDNNNEKQQKTKETQTFITKEGKIKDEKANKEVDSMKKHT